MRNRNLDRGLPLTIIVVLNFIVVSVSLGQDDRGNVNADYAKKAVKEAGLIAQLHKTKQWETAATRTEILLDGDPQFAGKVVAILLRDRSFKTRTHIFASVNSARLDSTIATYLELAQTPDEDEAVRIASIIGLGEFRCSPVVMFHLQQMSIADHDAQKNVRMSLARIGKSYLDYYVAGLRDTNDERRYHAIFALGELGYKGSVPALMKLLDSNVEWDPHHAAVSIEKITGIPWRTVTATTVKKDGSVSQQGKSRSPAEIKKDAEVWIAKHHREISKPHDASIERWVFTPQRPLHTAVEKVLYQGMSAKQVKIALGESERQREAGSVWYYPEDRAGNTIVLHMINDELQDWTLEIAAASNGK